MASVGPVGAASGLADILERRRAWPLLGIVGVAGLAWAYLATASSGHPLAHDIDLGRAVPGEWGVRDGLFALGMWLVMTMAMMLPTVAPWIATVSAITAPSAAGQTGGGVAWGFLAGYSTVWVAYAVVATLVQWGLSELTSLVTVTAGAGATLEPRAGAIALTVAGIYQWAPAKGACLRHCRSPFGFFLTSWADGRWGGVRMGARHGMYCLGCCWALMALSLVVGVMNLWWMAAMTAYLLLDHAVLAGAWASRVTGTLLVAWGGTVLLLDGLGRL